MEDLHQLIKECAANNRLSQEKLYYRFYPALMLMCKRFFADDHTALEALNDGMIKVFKKINAYQPEKGEFFNWIYTVVRNTALDKLKLSAIPVIVELNGSAEFDTNENPFQALEWQDIYTLLDKLPPATRAVCALFYLEGYSVNDAAEHLNLTAGTVKWHLHEGRKKLKPELQKYYS